MKYYAHWSANNGTTRAPKGAQFDNKKKALKWARECALGNRFYGNNAIWTITDQNDEIVYQGRHNGKKIFYSIKEYKLKF